MSMPDPYVYSEPTEGQSHELGLDLVTIVPDCSI
jgi:hypothetical protein